MTFFSAGKWVVKDGHDEDAFVKAWLASVDLDPPIQGLKVRPRLLRDLERPGHFLSFAEWDSRESIEAFRARPDFPEVIGRIKEHADFTIFTMEEVASSMPRPR